MIRVERGPAPQGFAERARAWNEGLQAARNAQPELTASGYWNQVRRQIAGDAEALAVRSHRKCAFCETCPEPCSAPQVEHYRPKSRPEFETRMFDWDNWLLSCGTCNQKKWTRFPETEGVPDLLDPAHDVPEEHLAFEEARILPRTRRGAATIALVKLDRSPLTDRRAEWLTFVRTLLLIMVRIPEARPAARLLLIWMMQDDAPHAAMTRCYLQIKTPRLATPKQPHPQVSPDNPVAQIRALVDRYAAELSEIA